MKFRLLIESHAYTTIRELHVERVTGPMTDLKRDHVDVLSLEPVADAPSGHNSTKKRPDALKDQVS